MIKVLIVDDSALIRGLLKEVLEQAQDIQVVGAAEDPYQARDLIKRLNPDVLTLDIENAENGWVKFFENLMRLRPMPVVMISTLTQKKVHPSHWKPLKLVLPYLLLSQPSSKTENLQRYAHLLHQKVRTAAGARIRAFKETKN